MFVTLRYLYVATANLYRSKLRSPCNALSTAAASTSAISSNASATNEIPAATTTAISSNASATYEKHAATATICTIAAGADNNDKLINQIN